MTTTTYTKLKEKLKKELFHELSGFMVRGSKDPEGEYRPEFVKRILHIAQKGGQQRKYQKKRFLKMIS